MYEEAWYNAFVPGSKARSSQPKQQRRSSLLGPPISEKDIDVTSPANSILEEPDPSTYERVASPPAATLQRRAKSYTDFYYVVKAQLRKDYASSKEQSTQRRGSVGQTVPPRNNELVFETWRRSALAKPIDAKHEQYLLYREQLRLSRRHLDSLLTDTSTNLELLTALSSAFRAVESQTSAFRGRCDAIVAEQRKLTELADNVSQNLQYYNYLDPITRRLNAPGAGHLVRSHDFSEMLANLDRCLEYMEAHPKQKEAATYRSRYRLLLTRGLTLIRVHFTNTLRETAAEVSARIADRQLNDTTMPTLLYAKFRVPASDLKQLGLEIQRRAIPPKGAEPGAQAEYQSLMNELYQSYSAARGRLIVPIVRRKMAELAATPSSTSDIVTFARSTIGYIRSMCMDESELWHEWFEGDGGLYDFLESMCEPLYDYLRPRTIKETQLAKLCETCNFIQAQYLEEAEDEAHSDDASLQLDFGPLIRPALEDAQTRLVFLAMGYLRNEIERFKPKAEDLDSGSASRPTLSGRKSSGPVLSGTKEPKVTPTGGANGMTANGIDGLAEIDSSAAYKGWYPTLRKAIWLLSRIYRLVNSTVFDDLAHQIVHQTTASLVYAAKLIKSKTNAVDSSLFLLKQLLILKSQIVSFDIEYVTPELDLDFSSVTSTFWELRERGGLFKPANLIRLIGGGLVPGVVENMLDAKVELDGKLRTVINDFINEYAGRYAAPLKLENAQKASFDAGTAVQEVRKTIEKDVPALRSKLDEYLDDLRTKETLVGAVQDQTIINYEAFFEIWSQKALANGQGKVSRKGKGHEEEVWDPDNFANWTAQVFSVARIGPDDENMYDDDDDHDHEDDDDDDDDDDGAEFGSAAGST